MAFGTCCSLGSMDASGFTKLNISAPFITSSKNTPIRSKQFANHGSGLSSLHNKFASIGSQGQFLANMYEEIAALTPECALLRSRHILEANLWLHGTHSNSCLQRFYVTATISLFNAAEAPESRSVSALYCACSLFCRISSAFCSSANLSASG